MRYAPTLAILLFGLAQTTVAEEAKPFEWTDEKFAQVAAGDAEEGKKLAKKFRCAKCHNKDGISDDIEIPSIAGQRATYMYKQMVDYKNRVRENKDMLKAMRKVSEDQMVHISTWYASLERPPKVGGERLLVVKVCDSCHEKEVVEEDNLIEVAPILSGQIRQYLEASMQAFKLDERSNDLFDRMQSVTHKLSDKEIRQLARYYGTTDIEE